MPPAKTIYSEIVGKKALRVVVDGHVYRGLVIAGGRSRQVVEGSDPDEVRIELKRRAGTAEPGYVGWGGAINRFRQFFPSGMGSERYRSKERDQKLAASKRLSETAPLALASINPGYGKAAWEVMRRIYLLDGRYDLPKLKDLFASADGDRFVLTAAQFALAPSSQHLGAMTRIASAYNCVSWPMLTILPFLWEPERHMFLKPEVTKTLAERVGHVLADIYRPPPDFPTYEDLLDLTAAIRQHIDELSPADGIDIQSFIWVAGGGYRDSDGVYR